MYNSKETILQQIKMGIMAQYSYSYGAYVKGNVLVKDIKGEITREYIQKTNKPLSPSDLNTMLANIKDLSNKTVYDFENIPYKTYVKRVALSQNTKEMKELKERYALYLDSIKDRKSNKQVFYIQGTAGSGKTTYAKILGEKYYGIDDVYISSNGEKMFDEYNGERVIILDDFRDSDMRYSQLLKLLDNNTTACAGARYHNKNLARCEIIIITSTIAPTDIYKGIEEERFQLYRRIKFLKINDGFLELYNYNRENEKYIRINEKNIQQELQKYYDEHPNENILKIDDLFEVNKSDLQLEDINEEDLPF